MDREVVTAAAAGDVDALRQLVDDHLDLVHGVTTVLLGAGQATAATADVFAVAAARLDQLPDPDHLRPWLLAICRNRSLGWPVDGSWRPSAHDELRLATVALEPRDRFLVELALARSIEGPELAAAMGYEPGRAGPLAQRAHRRAAGVVGALRLAQTGGRRCPSLAVLVAGRRHGLDSDLRRAVVRHAEDCDVCRVPDVTEAPEAVLAPAPLLVREVALAAAQGERPVPDELLAGWSLGWPPSAGREPRALDGGAVISGVAVWQAPVSDDRRQRVPIFVGVVGVLALVASVWLAGRADGGRAEVDLLGVAEPTFPPDPTTSVVVTTVPPPTPTTAVEVDAEVATTTASPPATTTVTTTSTTVAPPSPAAPPATTPPRPSPPPPSAPATTSTTVATTTTEPVGGALLAPAPPVLALTPGSSGTVRLSNVGPDPASWSASPSVGLGVSPASGSLGVGRSVVLTISASSRASSGSVTVNGGVAPVSIAVDVVPPPSMPPSTTSTTAPSTTTTTTEPGPTTTTTPVTIIDDDAGIGDPDPTTSDP